MDLPARRPYVCLIRSKQNRNHAVLLRHSQEQRRRRDRRRLRHRPCLGAALRQPWNEGCARRSRRREIARGGGRGLEGRFGRLRRYRGDRNRCVAGRRPRGSGACHARALRTRACADEQCRHPAWQLCLRPTGKLGGRNRHQPLGRHQRLAHFRAGNDCPRTAGAHHQHGVQAGHHHRPAIRPTICRKRA